MPPRARPRPRAAVAVATAAAVAVCATAALGWAQGWGRRAPGLPPNPPYDGRFAFVRLRYTNGHPGWSFDYPAMERNFMTIAADLTGLRPHVRESVVLAMDDPALGHYPVAYLSEPGFWDPDDREAAALGRWLRKGGFLIVDDFFGPAQWAVFADAMGRVLPGARFLPLDRTHPVFDSFFRIPSLEGMRHPSGRQYAAQFLGVFEDNNPARRLMAVVNFNNDIGDYMEWSGEGWYPVNLSNDAYKFATNYLVYGLSR